MQKKIDKAIKYNLHPMELAEYTRILPYQSGIPYWMYIDESASFKRWGHLLWMIVSDGDPYCDKWIAISVSPDPRIIAIGNHLKNDDKDLKGIDDCVDFVSKFYHILTDIATEKTDSAIIYDILEKHIWKEITKREISNLQIQLHPIYSLNVTK